MEKSTIGGHRKKVLIIDDQAALLETVELILVKEGYSVYGYQSGFNVTELVEFYVPDIILLDVLLPGTSGLVICKDLKKHVNTPIILFSSKLLDIGQLEACRADDFILKPFDLKKLLSVVEHHLNRRV